jgi:histidinol-phosphate/aromatic aminotransferase/cobyric acid decarboxylase-like protein
MPSPSCHCQCKFCRAPGPRHCHSSATCGGPRSPAASLSLPQHSSPVPLPWRGFDEGRVTETLRQLKAGSGSHSASVSEVERALPGLVQVDACFLSNPYAAELVLSRMREIAPRLLERMISHYPSQSRAIASRLAPYVGVPAEQLYVANGACEAIQAMLADTPGPLLLSIPTFSAYYEFASGPVVTHRLDSRDEFRLDLGELVALVKRHRPATVVIINPNNPDGGVVEQPSLVDFIERTAGLVEQVIVDESFAHFSTEGPPPTLAPLVARFPHLVVVNSMSKSHGIAGLRLGYAVMAPERAGRMRDASLWNMNAFAEWFCGLLADRGFASAYESARRRYVRETRRLFAGLAALPGVRAYPSAANYALLELDRPAGQVTASLLARHGVYVRDCGDKWGLDGERFIRVASRSRSENDRILSALAGVLSEPAPQSLTAAA